jgi:hypothetical protein
MRSFLRVSGERRKILLDSNVGMNFTLGSAFQVPSVKVPPPALENPSVTVPADKQSPNFTTDSFTKLDTQAFSLGTTGTFKPMKADEINNAYTGWLDFTDAEFTGDTVQANIPDAYEKVEGENKQAEAQAQQVAKQQQAANAKQTQELFTMIIQLLGMFGGGGMGGMGAIANVASGTTAATNTTTTSTAPTITTTPAIPVTTPTVVA